MLIAAIRPDSVNLPLFLHVLGAMLLVGTLIGVALATVLGWRSQDNAQGLARFSLKMLLLGVLPAYILMRVGAQWTESEQNYPDDFDPAWIGVGYITADAGALLILISLILGGVGLRKLRGRLERRRALRADRRRHLHRPPRRIPRRHLGDDDKTDLGRRGDGDPAARLLCQRDGDLLGGKLERGGDVVADLHRQCLTEDALVPVGRE